MKKITAVIGSPNDEKSNTVRLVRDFIDTVQEFDNAVSSEVISLGSKKVGMCRGCWGCTRTGRCAIEDDLQDIQAKLLKSDLIIIGSPVYVHQVSAQMKAFLDRSFIWIHTMRLLGKPGLTALTTAGTGAGPTRRYLRDALCMFGAIPVGHLEAIAYYPGVFLQRESYKKKYRNLAKRVVRILGGRETAKPTKGNIEYFRGIQYKVKNNPEFLRYEHEYWRRMGWFGKTYRQAAGMKNRMPQ